MDEARGILKFRELPSLKERFRIKAHKYDIFGMAISPDGKTVATVSWDGTARLWHAVTGQELLAIRSGWAIQYSVDFSPDGRYLAFTAHRGQTGRAVVLLRAPAERTDGKPK